MAGAQCCDNPPTLNPSSGSGHVDEVGGFKSYFSGSPDSKLAVLLISDVYGYEAPNLRKLADKVGAAGYFAVVPDFLHGDPFNPQNTERPIHAWIKDHGPDKAYEDAKVVIESLKHKGISKIGAAGFCWGAKVVVQLAQSDEYIQAGVFLHPSFVTVDDVKGVKVPLAVLGAETDHLSPPELVKQFEEALNAKPERLGNTSLHSPSQHPTPHICPETNYFEEQSPHVFQASNSQIEEDPEENVSETPQYPPPPLRVPTNSNQQLARVNRMWSVAEDEALIGLYLQFSEGAIVGTNQKASVLWRNVSAAYNEAQAEKPHILPPRPLKSLENRWRRMASDLLQWSAVYDEAGKITGSGYNEADRIQKASKLFFISSKPQPHNFTCFHGWEMVKNDPKWRSKLRWALSKEERLACGVDEDCESTESGKRSRTEAEGNGDGPGTGYSSGGLPRPDGVKKAKAKRNKGKATASHDVALSISEQMKVYNEERKYDRILREKKLDLDLQKEKRKQKMVELQERKMNFDMLQALLHKGAPLTASEEAWKEELIRLVYGGLNNE